MRGEDWEKWREGNCGQNVLYERKIIEKIKGRCPIEDFLHNIPRDAPQAYTTP